MTIKQTLQVIKTLPNMTASYSSEYREFRVRFIGRPDADYFTDDRGDALETAKRMHEDGVTSYTKGTQRNEYV